MSLPTVSSIAETRAAVAALRRDGRSIALVPTMGALHEGHLSLVARARETADAVVTSVFVNPLQFGPAEDFDRYPRPFDTDRAALESAGVDLLFAPAVTDMYPAGGTQITVAAGPVGDLLEGRVRPGHFDGMLTVVAKLLHIVGPDAVLFGQKDAQQVFLVRRMVADLNEPVRVEVVPTVREPDGLARSSRNRYLSVDERALALALPAALRAATTAADLGPAPMLAAARAEFDGRDGVVPDYLVAVDPATFQPVDDRYRGPALVLVAARVGGTRLIDNALVALR
ncbi:MAG TPA: pantoate--beta-alanine ligase [Amnibacterium sp.]|jgi:pantoate--beta-alanine ligase|nr:pantoate--beta-alanine ligase [Amnibacterium sp.]